MEATWVGTAVVPRERWEEQKAAEPKEAARGRLVARLGMPGAGVATAAAQGLADLAARRAGPAAPATEAAEVVGAMGVVAT